MITVVRIFYLMLFICCSTTAYGQTLKFKKSFDNDSLYLELINYLAGPVSIKISDITSDACIRVADIKIIPAFDSIPNVVAVPISCISDTSLFKWSMYFNIDALLGDPQNSKHNNEFLYQLPYKRGKSYAVLQGWNGKFSHRSKRSKYAIDFKMPIGDTICAARGGVVALTEDKYTESGGKDFINKANKIVIIHDDGTLASYVHLDHKGLLVSKGDTVKIGQAIGISGNTGYSTKPHLHFVVREAPDLAVPVYFKGFKKKKLRTGKFYLRK